MKWEKIVTHRSRDTNKINTRNLYEENMIIIVIPRVTIVRHDGSHLLFILHLHYLLNSNNYG